MQKQVDEKYFIKSDDPEAIEKLTERMDKAKERHQFMVQANEYYRDKGTLEGFISDGDWVAKKESDMVKYKQDMPYADWMINNNKKKIEHNRERIKTIEYERSVGFSGWAFEGGMAVANKADNKLQIQFDEKPDEEVRDVMKLRGFNWNGESKVWERQLTQNAITTCDSLDFLKTTEGKRPSEVQPKPPQASKEAER